MKNIIYNTCKAMSIMLCFALVISFNSCTDSFEFELPEANSIDDLAPPSANFSYASTLEDFRTIKFTNLSEESTTYAWDFGGGAVSDQRDPTYTFSGEGTFPVTLTSSDALGQNNEITIDVMVVEGPFQPIILEPGFEDNSLPDGSGDGRDSWRTSIGGVIQITGSPVTFGAQGAKLPNDESRVGYQEIAVVPNTNYDLRFWYTMLANPTDPFVTVSILGVTQFGPFETRESTVDGTLASVTVTDITDPDVYLEQQLSFNSGDNNTIAIYFFNGPVEARLDNFTIDIGAEGAVPPSAGFDVAQSDENFLEYTFTNGSTGATSYEWDFGDGNISTEESPTHVYETPAEYTVTMTAFNDAGLSTSLTRNIDIQAPVTVDCTWEVDPEDYRTVHFADASIGAESLLWEFGDGFQFTGMSASHTYRDDGIYTVTLTSTSITGLQDSKQFDVTISQGFIATISEASFEDNDPSAAACGSALDGRDCWRNSALGGVIQITSGPTVTGSQAAKMPDDGSRIGYQRVMVEPNTLYNVSFNYTMKNSPEGSLTVAILDGSTLNDISEVAGATLASVTVNDQTDENAYVTETITFNSGAREEVAIFFTNAGVECRLDDFSIEAAEVPMLAEGGFEDNTLADGSGDGRDSWRNSALGGVIQITSGPLVSGSQAAKLPNDGSRIGYQKVAVVPNAYYTLTYHYTLKTDAEGSVTVSILNGSTLNDISEVPAATIATSMVNDQTDADAYVQETITFNTGDNAEVAVFFTNAGAEARLDDISLSLAQGFVPMVGEGGFEDNTLDEGTGDGRDSWRNSLGGVIQITSSPVNSGSQAAKLPNDGSRVGMQEIEVDPNTNYRVTFFYTLKTDAEGSVTVSILDDTASSLTELSQVGGATIATTTVNDQTDADAYVMESIEFNSGGNSTISIFFTNAGAEARLDDVSITTL